MLLDHFQFLWTFYFRIKLIQAYLMRFSTHYESFLIIACLSLSLSQDSKFQFCTISLIFEYFVNLHAKVR